MCSTQPSAAEPAAGQVGAGVVAPHHQDEQQCPRRAGAEPERADRGARATRRPGARWATSTIAGMQQPDVGHPERGHRPGHEARPRVGSREPDRRQHQHDGDHRRRHEARRVERDDQVRNGCRRRSRSLVVTRPAATIAMPPTIVSTCGGWWPAASSRPTSSTSARKATTPTRIDSHGSPSRTIARMIGTSTTARDEPGPQHR